MSTRAQTVFFLGATGYLGSQFLLLLNEELPQLHVIALLRNATPERKEQLQRVYSNMSFVEGSLDDDAIIQEQAAKADVVINCANSYHPASAKSTLAGLETNSKNNPGKPPIYIHMSGTGIVSDNARGEAAEHVKEWTDIGLDLKKCNPINAHLDSDIPIVEAGSRTKNPVRTIIYIPSQIYGIGEGIQKTTVWLRLFLDNAKRVGHVSTWGPGANVMNTIHVKDCAMGLFLILQAALEGRADEGPEGLYFAASMELESRIAIGQRSWVIKGIIREAGSHPIPAEAVHPLGGQGWSVVGGNQFVKAERLYKLGWEPTESKRSSLLDSLLEAIEQALKE